MANLPSTTPCCVLPPKPTASAYALTAARHRPPHCPHLTHPTPRPCHQIRRHSPHHSRLIRRHRHYLLRLSHHRAHRRRRHHPGGRRLPSSRHHHNPRFLHHLLHHLLLMNSSCRRPLWWLLRTWAKVRPLALHCRWQQLRSRLALAERQRHPWTFRPQYRWPPLPVAMQLALPL